jgi:hypothetical protein
VLLLRFLTDFCPPGEAMLENGETVNIFDANKAQPT